MNGQRERSLCVGRMSEGVWLGKLIREEDWELLPEKWHSDLLRVPRAQGGREEVLPWV